MDIHGVGLTNQLVPRATDSGVGTGCEVEDIEHSEESEEGTSEDEDVLTRCVTTFESMWSLINLLAASVASRSSLLISIAA
jgi:hypothetical protein